MNDFVGILPAAGQGSRLKPFQRAKELLPVAFVRQKDAEGFQPVLAMEYSLMAFKQAGISEAFLLINQYKHEIFRLFGDGRDRDVRLAYVCQEEPAGLARAVAELVFWTRDAHVALALPDTVFKPLDALALLKREILEKDLDLVLGVFPTSEPQNLSPVQLDDTGCVLGVFEKPNRPVAANTWGLAVWSPRFSRLLGPFLKSVPAGAQPSISHAFDFALKRNLRVSAIPFPEGAYVDMGTPNGLKTLVTDFPEVL